jgi:hypothetical protein
MLPSKLIRLQQQTPAQHRRNTGATPAQHRRNTGGWHS